MKAILIPIFIAALFCSGFSYSTCLGQQAKVDGTFVVRKKKEESLSPQLLADSTQDGISEDSVYNGYADIEVEDTIPSDYSHLDELAKPLNYFEFLNNINYPPEAKEAGIEGKVVLRVHLNERGEYVKHVVFANPHSLLTAAIEDHIKELKFTPARLGSRPIEMWLTIPFVFKLNK